MKIIGTGSALPKKVVTNGDLESFLDTTDDWIVTRTGIHSRHVISDERLEDLGRDAALKALADAGRKPEDIDLLLCSNVVNEYMTPGLGCIIAAAVGLHCPCIDINCACPGFIYALDIADSYFKVGKVKNVLIVCAEEPTRMTSWQDRATCVLFGDGAGAVVLSEGEGVRAVRIGARPDPDKIWQFRPLEPTPFVTKSETVLADAGLGVEDVDYFMIHQANLRIVEGIRNRLGAPESKFPTNIGDHGNSSSASCPILLDECKRKGLFKKGDKLIFSAFGAGLLTAAALVEW